MWAATAWWWLTAVIGVVSRRRSDFFGVGQSLYIVYLGEKRRLHENADDATASHHRILASVLGSEEAASRSMVYSYKHGFSGFSAMLTESQAGKLGGLPGVTSVRMNQVHSTHTTRSWDFMGLPHDQPNGILASAGMGEGVIIGVIDSGPNFNQALQAVQPKLTPQMNDLLIKEYTVEEVKRALDDMGDLKAPGADGMPAIFYKRFWSTVGEAVTREVLHVLRGGSIPEGWNETIVVLIPKVRNPDRIKDLRPISLCNVVYKLVSKVLANRLKQILDEIISANQSAFVPGRLISDNTILAYEMTHFMRRKRRGKDVYMALKLDMSKAYDRVEWLFLEGIMKKLGFIDEFVQLIMKCVKTCFVQVKSEWRYLRCGYTG
ncbi:uncharacterized protein [Aegilops tauschii subsp. strangulata]|uniref:uncharacterized protein isoform X2 n=1 Tax=Aegilops tauschii subsp. strangulata TaxID=200361 RepID=UPI001E1CA1EA|nr:uncharacterized protein LOC109763361 isoform X2 [Aegilops tauschii subsp. strangulata]